MYIFMEPKFKEHFKKFRIIFNFKKVFRENLNVHFFICFI